MKRLSICLAFGLCLGLACGGDDSDDSDSGMDSQSSATDVQTSSSMETCNSNHMCIGGACECTTPGKEGEACDNEVACEEQCEVCV